MEYGLLGVDGLHVQKLVKEESAEDIATVRKQDQNIPKETVTERVGKPKIATRRTVLSLVYKYSMYRIELQIAYFLNGLNPFNSNISRIIGQVWMECGRLGIGGQHVRRHVTEDGSNDLAHAQIPSPNIQEKAVMDKR